MGLKSGASKIVMVRCSGRIVQFRYRETGGDMAN